MDSLDDVMRISSLNQSTEGLEMSTTNFTHSKRHKPIIMITSESPDHTDTEPLLASPPTMRNCDSKQRLNSASDDKQCETHAHCSGGCEKGCEKEIDGIPRSATDSNIKYSIPDASEEASGSVFYIDKDGHINMNVSIALLNKNVQLLLTFASPYSKN